MFLSKYGVARHLYLVIVKRAVVDFAVSADWTPAAGDVKISKDGGAAANVTNLPTAITMGNTAIWDFSLTATEMQAKQIVVTVADAATKAIEDQAFVIETYGDANAQHVFDLGTAMSAQSVSSVSGSVGSVTGAVGSVTGAVGSVTGNVGGNVTGSVGSVTGDVGGKVLGGGAGTISGTGVTAQLASNQDVRNVTGNVSGSVGSVTGAVGSVTGNVGGNVTGSVGSVATGGITNGSFAANALTAAKLDPDVTDEIWAKAATEPTGAPSSTATMVDVLSWLLALSLLKITQTATTQTLRNSADSANVATSTHSDDGTTHVRGKWA